ncbi:MAG: hypothetical protein WEC84_00380 [Candidatus Andersenbacteria bacterium]
MTKRNIFFITGVSTSGKTTLIPHIKNNLPENFLVYDFDERGVPDNVTAEWRREETAHWIRIGIENAKQDKNTVICGISVPSEVARNTELLEKIDPHYLLLNVSPAEIKKRFVARLSTKEAQLDWARTTGLSVEESVARNVAFAANLREVCKEYACKVFDTSETTPERTAINIAKWILKHASSGYSKEALP